MDPELTASERHQLVDFARAMIDRARQANPTPGEAEEEPSLSFREDLDAKSVIELLSGYLGFFDKIRTRLTRELDAVLLIVERLEVELTTLRGEVAGLRNERAEFLSRLKRAEQGLDAAAEEFTRRISDQVTRLTDRFSSYVDGVSQTARNVKHASAEPRGDQKENAAGPLADFAAPAENSVSDDPLDGRAISDITGIDLNRRAASGPARIGLARLASRWLPHQSWAHDAKAIAWADRARDMRNWRTAARYYRKALNHRPNNPPIWVQYGHALKELGNKAGAETAYEKSIELDPNVADTHLQLGHVLKLQGKSGAAAAAYLRAAALDPSLRDARTELIELGWTQRRIQQALQFQDQVI